MAQGGGGLGGIRSMTPEHYAALFIGPLLEYGRRMVRDTAIADEGSSSTR